MRTLRTPDERFDSLPDYHFAPNYAAVGDGEGTGGELRVHYIDEGPRDGSAVVLMHGEPSWCFLYRHMVPVLVGAGMRVVAPDLVGFGRSDKPAEQTDHTYARHVEWMRALLFDRLDLGSVTLVGQDWGGLVGLRLVAEHPERFARVVVANTGLPTGDHPMSDAFLAWQRYASTTATFEVGNIVRGGCATTLSAEVVAAYDAPFPDDSFKAGPRAMPTLVPTRPDDPAAPANRAAWEGLRRFTKPFLTAFSDRDPVTKGGDAVFKREVPGAATAPHSTIEGAGHFLQEDRGTELAGVVARFVQTS
jgi:haloalkane dehalogenase